MRSLDRDGRYIEERDHVGHLQDIVSEKTCCHIELPVVSIHPGHNRHEPYLCCCLGCIDVSCTLIVGSEQV